MVLKLLSTIALSLLSGVATAELTVLPHVLFVGDAGVERTFSCKLADSCATCDGRDVEFIVRKVLTNSQVAFGVTTVQKELTTLQIPWTVSIPKSGIYKLEARQCWDYSSSANSSAECQVQSAERCCSDWSYSTDPSDVSTIGWILYLKIGSQSGGGIG